MHARFDMRRPMLVDDLEGSVHTAYGLLPNMTWIVERGRILYKASWTDERTIAAALEHWTWEREESAAKRRLTPYWLEWAPKRNMEREVFMAAMLDVAGPRAVEEFISAIEATRGERAGRSMRQWWDAQRREDP